MLRLSIPFLAACLVVFFSCAKEPDTSPLISRSVDAKFNAAPCGQLLARFEQLMVQAKSCKQDVDCLFFETSPTGCWRLYNRSFKGELMELSRELERDRCSVFLPMYKCNVKPGEPACVEERCLWMDNRS